VVDLWGKIDRTTPERLCSKSPIERKVGSGTGAAAGVAEGCSKRAAGGGHGPVPQPPDAAQAPDGANAKGGKASAGKRSDEGKTLADRSQAVPVHYYMADLGCRFPV